MARESRRPNVLVVVFDDMGYSDLACYGSTIRTPNCDRLAAAGLRYTRFDVTPLCSPTRASLLTGRNPHAVGMGTIVNFATGEPGYSGVIPDSAAMLPLILKDAGYASGLFGKWHLSPNAESGPGGPYEQWPLERGFDRFFGWLSGRVHQFRPELVQDNSFLDAAAYGGRHVSELIVDEAIRWIADHRYARPDDPYFTMISFGAVHSPHHAPEEYRAGYRGAFHHGWAEERRRRFNRQREIGVVPAHTTLPPSDPRIPAWASLSSQEQLVAERLMEAYAGHLEHADAQLGRLLRSIDFDQGDDETLVVVMSDNGATDAGAALGTLSEEAVLNVAPFGPADVDLDAIGGPKYYNQYPAGWGQASNTPFRRYKNTVHNGGTRSPLIMAGSALTHRRGSIDHTTSFVTDIALTILDLADTPAPRVVRGVQQQPLQGRSLLPTFEAPRELGTRGPQYFEVAGHRAIASGDWKAVTFHTPGSAFEEDRWELYDLAEDPAETHDLSLSHPERLLELISQWWAEAQTNNVLPLGSRGKSGLSRASRPAEMGSRPGHDPRSSSCCSGDLRARLLRHHRDETDQAERPGRLNGDGG
jgi:arylsulfatase